jgi:hypothetical protein
MPETATRTCGECEGWGYILYPVCWGGEDHAGHDCGGTACGDDEVECEACEGTGQVEADE